MFHPVGGQRKGFAAQQILPAAAGYLKRAKVSTQ
jgi:hypothetical protein